MRQDDPNAEIYPATARHHAKTSLELPQNGRSLLLPSALPRATTLAMLYMTKFAHWRSTIPLAVTANTWQEICTQLDLQLPHHITTLPKESTPAFSPVSYLPQTTRSNRAVAEVCAFVADYDQITRQQLSAVMTWLHDRKLQYAVYSTYSHGTTPDHYSLRVLVPLSAPVPAKRWREYVWQLLQAQLPVPPDPACKDPARIYGLPYTTAANQAQAFSEVCADPDYGTWEVPAVPAALNNYAFGTPQRPLLTAAVWDSADALDRWVRALAQYSGDADKGWQYAVISALRRGKPIADVEMGRHETMLRVTALVERRYPFVALDALADIFVPSLQAMATTDPSFRVDERRQDILRALEGARTQREQRAAGGDLPQRQQQAQVAAQAPATTTGARLYNDPTPYTTDELLTLARSQGYQPVPGDREDPQRVAAFLQKRWLVVRKSTYYILTLAGYTPGIAASDLEAELYRLEPAVSAGVQLRTPTPAGASKPVPIKRLQQDYGRVADEVVISYTTPASRLVIAGAGDGRTTLHLRGGQVRQDLQPRYRIDVARWLELLAGPHHDVVLDWLACVPRLSEPLAALYISGPSGIGKNLLSLSLAKLFHDGGPVDLGTVLGAGRFNDALIRCPIALADEAMPSEATFENVCEFIGTTSRAMKEKYVAQATLLGAARLVLTANTPGMMSFAQHSRRAYTREQFAAVAKRILHVDANPREQELLTFLRETPAHYTWLQDDAVTEHILHLAATRTVERQPGARFLVEGNFSQMLDTFVATNPLLSRVVEWLARYLYNPLPLERSGPLRGKVQCAAGGVVQIPPAVLHAAWKLYADAESRAERPSPEQLALALDTLADPEPAPRGVPLRHVLRWAARTEFCKPDHYHKFLRTGTVADIVAVTKEAAPS